MSNTPESIKPSIYSDIAIEAIRDNILTIPRFNVIRKRIEETDLFKVFYYELLVGEVINCGGPLRKIYAKLGCGDSKSIAVVLYIFLGFNELFTSVNFAYAFTYRKFIKKNLLKRITGKGLAIKSKSVESMSEKTLIERMVELKKALNTTSKVFCDNRHAKMLDDLLYIMRSEIFHF